MSRTMKVLVALLAIAVMAAPAFAGTVFDKDGFKYNLDGDLQIQFDQNGNDDDDLIIEYDDLEIKNTASYQIDDAMSVYGKFDFAGNQDGGDWGNGIKMEEAYLGGAYNNFFFRYGSFDNTLDDFGVEAAYENTFNGDVFDYAGAANSDNIVEVGATFDMVTVTLGHELESDTRDADEYTFINVGFSVAGVGVTVAYLDDATNDADAYGVSAGYDFGAVAVGADYSYWEDDADAEITAYNVVVKAPVGEKAKVAVGFNSEEVADETYDSFYANGSYALASGANVFAELRDSDNRDDIAYTFGMQVKF